MVTVVGGLFMVTTTLSITLCCRAVLVAVHFTLTNLKFLIYLSWMVDEVIHPCPAQVVEVSGSRAGVSTSLPLLSSTDQCSAAGGLLLLLLQERGDGWPGRRVEGGGEMCTEEGPTGK